MKIDDDTPGRPMAWRDDAADNVRVHAVLLEATRSLPAHVRLAW
jgi:hypothetical protein